MNQTRIAFIGAGNMSNALIGGVLASGYSTERIVAADPSQDQLHALFQRYGIEGQSDNRQTVAGASIVVLAVKPQHMASVAGDLAGAIPADAVAVSIAAGITTQSLQQWLDHTAVVRCMPNTPALVQQGASGLFATPAVTLEQRQSVQALFDTVGITCWVERESLIDVITALSGSGPAYFFRFIEAMARVATDMGLNATDAERLAIQTCKGAGILAERESAELAELRQRVTSPGGTTERALQRFEADGLEAVVEAAMRDCAARAAELSRDQE